MPEPTGRPASGAVADELAECLRGVLGTVAGRRAWQERWPKLYVRATAALALHERTKREEGQL